MYTPGLQISRVTQSKYIKCWEKVEDVFNIDRYLNQRIPPQTQCRSCPIYKRECQEVCKGVVSLTLQESCWRWGPPVRSWYWQEWRGTDCGDAPRCRAGTWRSGWRWCCRDQCPPWDQCCHRMTMATWCHQRWPAVSLGYFIIQSEY